MWTYINENNFQLYLNQHSSLIYFRNEISLQKINNNIYLPKLFYQNYPSNLLTQYYGKDKVKLPDRTNFNFIGRLRSEQLKITKTILHMYEINGYVNGIIKARPGLGKTVLALYLASKIGLKTCIIVDNSELLKQWTAAISEFTDVDEVGIVRQKSKEVDKPIVVAMLQTLLSKVKRNLSEAYDLIGNQGNFGLVIFDEVHSTSSAPKVAKVSLLFRTRNIIGLSATPFQTGIAEILMKNTIGEIIYDSKEYDMKPEYYLVHYNSGLGKQYSTALQYRTDYIRKKTYYNSIIINSKKYLSLITDKTKLLLENDHRVIIICSTVKQVKLISDTLSDSNIDNRRFYSKEKEIDKTKDRVLVVTYSFAGKGFDYKELSAMILATPLSGRKSLIQSIGRILRSSEEKKQPIVYDLIDESFPTFFLREEQIKKNIISDEFHCKICEIKY